MGTLELTRAFRRCQATIATSTTTQPIRMTHGQVTPRVYGQRPRLSMLGSRHKAWDGDIEPSDGLPNCTLGDRSVVGMAATDAGRRSLMPQWDTFWRVAPRRGVVYLAEDRETVGLGEEIFCATFSGYHDGGDTVRGEIINATLPEALAWANALADDVQLRLADGHHYFAAGRLNSANDPTWPPDDLEPVVRRRPPGEAWRDLPDDAPDSRWRVQIHAHPPTVERRPEWDALIQRLAATIGADWSAASLDAAVADIRRKVSWTTSHATAYTLAVHLVAPNARTAERLALAQVELPTGWRLRAPEVAPAKG